MGCGDSEKDGPSIKWSGNITEQSECFILSYDQVNIVGPLLPTIEQWWVDVQTCVGASIDLTGRPLIIEYTPPEGLPEANSGWIDWHKHYTRIAFKPSFRTVEPVVKEEMIHYLLFLTGEDDTDNAEHASIWFDDCTYSTDNQSDLNPLY